MSAPQKRERGGAHKNVTLEVRLDKKKNVQLTGAQRPAEEAQGKGKNAMPRHVHSNTKGLSTQGAL